MIKHSRLLTLALGAAVVSAGLAGLGGSAAAGEGTRLKTDLAGVDAIASGNAKWESRRDRTKLSVEGEDFLPDSYVTIAVACETPFMAQVKTDGFGFFDLDADSRGPVALPQDCEAGDYVTVTGNDVISGTFAPD